MEPLLPYVPYAVASPILLGIGGIHYMKLRNQRQADQQRLRYGLTFPGKFDEKQVGKLLRVVMGSISTSGVGFLAAPTIVFEMSRTDSGFTYEIWMSENDAKYIIPQMYALVPGMTATPVEGEADRGLTYAVELRTRSMAHTLSIQDASAVSHSLQAATDEVRHGERVTMQLVVMPARSEGLPSESRTSRANHFGLGLALTAVQPNRDELADQRAKVAEGHNVLGVLRLGAHAATPERGAALVAIAERALRANTSSRYNGFTRQWWGFLPPSLALARMEQASAMLLWPVKLSISELAALVAWPIGEPNRSDLPQTGARYLAAAANVPGDSQGIIWLADSNVPGRERPVGMTMRGATMHTYISTPTGGGKTVALGNGFVSVVGQPFNCGAFVLETTNKPDDLFHRTLDYVPPERVERGDVVVIDLTDNEYAVAVNLFENGAPEVVADNLQNLFDELYRHNAGTLTVPEAIHHGVIALMTTTAAPYKLSFVDLMLLFRPRNDAEYELGQRIATNVPDREVREFWRSTYANNPTPEKMQAYFRPLARRIWQLNSRKQLRALFGQSHSAVNIFDAIRQHKIIEVNVGGLGDSIKNIVGAMFIDLVWDAVKRGAASVDRPFHLFIDEFQNYPNLARNADVMLSEGRGFGLAMWLANQGLYQLPMALQNAVTNNARNKWVMQQDDANAAMFARQFGRSVSADDIGGLPAHVAVARVIGSDGGLTAPFTAKMRPPVPGFGLAERAREISRLKYGRPIAEVEEELERRWRVEPTPKQKRPPLGKKGG